jgi:phospholipid/cholesterol/gamma-HCH transport system substrate-binding protein
VLKDIKGDYLNTYLSVTAPRGTTIIPPVKPAPTKGAPGQAQQVLPLPAVGTTTAPTASPSRAAGGARGGGG